MSIEYNWIKIYTDRKTQETELIFQRTIKKKEKTEREIRLKYKLEKLNKWQKNTYDRRTQVFFLTDRVMSSLWIAMFLASLLYFHLVYIFKHKLNMSCFIFIVLFVFYFQRKKLFYLQNYMQYIYFKWENGSNAKSKHLKYI